MPVDWCVCLLADWNNHNTHGYVGGLQTGILFAQHSANFEACKQHTRGWLSQWGPGCMPIGLGRSGGGVRLRPVSGMRGEGGGVLPRGAGTSGALVVVLEAAGCGRRAKVCLARFILRYSVAAASSSFSSSACRALRRDSNWGIVSSLQK